MHLDQYRQRQGRRNGRRAEALKHTVRLVSQFVLHYM